MATNNLPKITVNGNTTTIGFPSGMSKSSIAAALKKQGQPQISTKGTAQDRALANRAAAKQPAKPAAKKPATKPVSTTKSQSAARSATPKTVSSAPSNGGSVGGYDGAAFVAGAQDQFGYNPSLQYTPIDTSKMMDLLGKWDPNSISDVYKGAYDNLERLRQQGRSDYDTGDAKLSSIYSGLQDEIRGSVGGIQAAYDTARTNMGADARMLSSAASADAQAVQSNRARMLQNLGIESAAPDLNATDAAAAETSSRVTQAAGTQMDLAGLLGANATAYTQNTANNAGLQGAEARSGLLSQYNDYIGDLAGKQSDIDTSKAQALNSGYQNWQDAYRQLGLQKMQFDMQNSQNSYNAANQNNQNAMSMYQNYQSQMANDAKMQSDAAAAQMQAQSDADKLAYQRFNDDRNYALDRQKALSAGTAAPKDFYSVVGSYAATQGVSGSNLSNVMSMLNGIASRNGLGNSPGAFADAAAKVGVSGVSPNVLAGIAAQYWQASGSKASGNVY